MGQSYYFECPSCNYSVTASDGVDCGFVAVVQSMICTDCTEVVDVLIGERGKVFARDICTQEDKFYICPKCKKDHLSEWENKECPKCGQIMENEGLGILWD